MKRLVTFIMSFAIILAFSSTASAAGFTLDASHIKEGLLIVDNIVDTDKRMRIRIIKDEQKYLYEIRTDRETESYPLQMGSGEYRIDILENVIDNRYRILSTTKVEVDIENDLNVYLNCIQPVFWSEEMSAMNYAKTISDSTRTDEQKIKTIYNHMVYYYKYDWDKYGKLPSTYVPDIDETYIEKKGICYDYASLTAAFLRNMGYPARLVKGYSTLVNGYHAWNEIYVNGKWVVVDTTYDSLSDKRKISFAKDRDDYKPVGIY